MKIVQLWFITLGLLAFIVPQTAHAFEEAIVQVTNQGNTVTFIVADPRAVEHITTAILVSPDEFETDVPVDWKSADGGPGSQWSRDATGLSEIYFPTDIPLTFEITGPWKLNAAGNGIVRDKYSTLMPLVVAN